MEAALQNEVTIKLAEMEQRLNMSQSASTRIMRVEVERLQAKLQAEMDSKMDSKLEVMLAPMLEQNAESKKQYHQLSEALQNSKH